MVPKTNEITVELAPTIAEPIPAMCPNYSMAMALKLPKRMPMQKKDSIIYDINPQRGNELPNKKAIGKTIVARVFKVVMEMSASRYIPKRITKRELTIDDVPIDSAKIAK